MRPIQIEGPATPLVAWSDPVGLAAHCSLELDDPRRELVEGYERAAVAYLDGYSGRLGRCLLRQKWARLLIDAPDVVRLPFPDCREFQFERFDGSSWTDVPGGTFQGFEDTVCISDLPDDLTGLHLTFYAGWETAGDVPEDLKQAVRFLVAHFFTNRSEVTTSGTPHQVPMAVEALIAPYRRVFG